MLQDEPPTRIYCPPKEKRPPMLTDTNAPVRIYPPPQSH